MLSADQWWLLQPEAAGSSRAVAASGSSGPESDAPPRTAYASLGPPYHLEVKL